MKPPLVSVVMAVHNGQEFLNEAIESALNQRYEAVEIIVVDDGSSDSTQQIATSFQDRGIRYLRQGNQGPSSARNRGIEEARGDYMTFLDHDDLWHPEKLGRQVDFHLSRPGIDFSFVMEEFFSASGFAVPEWSRKAVFQKPHVAYIPSSMMALSAVFSKVGPFNPELRTGECSEWIFRARDEGFRMGVLNEVLMKRRIHNNNLSNDVRGLEQNLLHTIKTSIERRREQAESRERKSNKKADV